MNVTLTINGLTTQAFFPHNDIARLHLPLLQHFADSQRQQNQPLIVFMVAPPGTGKSTLSAFWEHLSRNDQTLMTVQTLPMDGFHHTNHWLEQQGLRHKKGAPETFDLAKLRRAILALRSPGSHWPEYSRALHDPVEEAISVTAPILIVEGNWLLLDEPEWSSLAELCDISLFIQAEPDILRDRLIERKMRGGLSRQQAEDFFTLTDGPNVTRVLQHSLPADITLHMSGNQSYRRLGL